MKGYYKIRKDGKLEIDNGEKSYLYKNENSIFEHPVVVLILLALCSITDFAMFYQLISKIFRDSPMVRAFVLFGFILGFDVAPIYLGITYKKMKQGYDTNKIIMSIMLILFLLCIAANSYIRFNLKDLTIESVNNPDLISRERDVTALIGTVIPIVTSFLAFSVSYFTTDYLKKRERQLLKAKLNLTDRLNYLKQIVIEYENDDYSDRLKENDENLYQAHVKLVVTRSHLYADMVRQKIKEFLQDPTSLSSLSDRHRAKLNLMIAETNAFEVKKLGEGGTKDVSLLP